MFDKLIDLIVEFIEDILPFTVIDIYDRGVMLRFGKTHRILLPGFHWKIPFVDKPLPTTVVTRTEGTLPQSLVLADGTEIVVKAVIKFNIDDIQKYTEDIVDQSDAIMDITQGRIMQALNGLDYEDCRDVSALSHSITIAVRREVRKYGIYIENITITDLVASQSMRIFLDNS